MGGVVKAITSPIMSLVGGIRAGKATDRAANHQISGMKTAQSVINPYMASGEQANTMLQNKLASGQLGASFTPGDLTKDPGYQFNLEQGEQALARRQAAGGNYFSGAALKDAQRFGQGLASTTYNDAFNRYMREQQNLYNMLAGQQNLGYGAARDFGNYATGIGNVSAERTLEKERQRMKMANEVFNSGSALMGGFGFGG